MANTAFTNWFEAKVLNMTLRNEAFAGANPAAFTQPTTTLYIALMTNVTNDGTLTEMASGTGGYSTRLTLTNTTYAFGQGGAQATWASAAFPTLSNTAAVTFTASGGTTSAITGIAICTSNTISATASSDQTILYYGDLTGGAVTLNSGQSITFAANSIVVSLD